MLRWPLWSIQAGSTRITEETKGAKNPGSKSTRSSIWAIPGWAALIPPEATGGCKRKLPRDGPSLALACLKTVGASSPGESQPPDRRVLHCSIAVLRYRHRFAVNGGHERVAPAARQGHVTMATHMAMH